MHSVGRRRKIVSPYPCAVVNTAYRVILVAGNNHSLNGYIIRKHRSERENLRNRHRCFTKSHTRLYEVGIFCGADISRLVNKALNNLLLPIHTGVIRIALSDTRIHGRLLARQVHHTRFFDILEIRIIVVTDIVKLKTLVLGYIYIYSAENIYCLGKLIKVYRGIIGNIHIEILV